MKRIYLILLGIVGWTFLIKAQNVIATLALSHIEDTYIQQNPIIQNDTVIRLNYPKTITGLSISGTATLRHSSNSLVRITLEDDYNTEWLVYELFPLLADSTTTSFNNVAFETSALDNVTAKQLNIKIINASLQLDQINTTDQSIANYSSRQIQMMEAQSSYIIDKLNENLEKRNIPWRAGETSVSGKTYEEKKAMFGGEVPNLGGFEYYKGGIFVMPDYEAPTNEGVATLSTSEEEDNPYVREWDWRNRHGKNWMTSVKNQGSCGSCWAFATVGALEAYINLYYNQQLNLDLSEQELVSCAYVDNPDTPEINEGGCGGGYHGEALEYIKEVGIINESGFVYTGTNNDCSNKSNNPLEVIRITSHNTTSDLTENELRKKLFKAPVIVTINSWNHVMTLVGFKVLQENDTIWYTNEDGYQALDILRNGHRLIGANAWIFKNSWGNYPGSDNGYCYFVANWNDLIDFSFIEGNIKSINYTDNDILITDNDDDGYFVWGFGERPSTLPHWASNKQDGDDTNENFRDLDEYGNLLENTVGSSYYVYGEYNMNDDNFFNYGFVVNNNATLRIGATIKMHKDATIIVKSGGTLIVDGGTLHRGNVVLENGSRLEIQNGGQINLLSNDNVDVQLGATVLIENGAINKN